MSKRRAPSRWDWARTSRAFNIGLVVLVVAIVLLVLLSGCAQPAEGDGDGDSDATLALAPGEYPPNLQSLIDAHPVLEDFDSLSIYVHLGTICDFVEEGYSAERIAYEWAMEDWAYQRLPIADAQALVDYAVEFEC